MAAPLETTLSRLDGKFVLNKKFSDSVDAILALQGISWPLRKAASLATPTLSITSSTRQDDGVSCIEITSVVSRGFPGAGSTEKMALDWSTWEKKDVLLGPYQGKMGWCTAAELSTEEEDDGARFLRGTILKDGGGNNGGWCDDDGKAGEAEKSHVRMLLESSKNGWVAEHVWGFEIVDGQRRYTRRLVGRKGDRLEMARLVYDYLGKI